MPTRSWILTDIERDVHSDNLVIDPTLAGGAVEGCKVSQRRLKGGLQDNVDLVEINNGRMRVAILPTRGMGIWKAWCGDWEIGWHSPVKGPVHPALVPVWEPSGIGWLNGFDELLCRCGLESNGAPEFDAQGRLKYPLHGRIANLPAQRVQLTIDDDSGEITLVGEVEERRLFGNHLRLRSTITTFAGEPGFRIVDEIENPSDSPAELELLYHINFGPPLLGDGSRIVAPVKSLVPRNARAAEGLESWDLLGPPQQGFQEQVYLMDLLADAKGDTRVMLKSACGELGVSLSFNVGQLPKFIVWKCTQGINDGYVVGLEPALNLPNPRSFEKQHGRIVTLAPAERRSFEVGFSVLCSASDVVSTESAIRRLQTQGLPTIYPRPEPAWCFGS